MEISTFRQLPSVDNLLRRERLKSWESKLIQPVRVKLAQRLIESIRRGLTGSVAPSIEELEVKLEEAYQALDGQKLGKVINATGVVLHTNLGRAPLGRELLLKMSDELSGYCNLEFSLGRGERGDRGERVDEYLSLLLGDVSSLVVNNNAAALVLLLNSLAKGKKVIVSRGELVQIGGGFRIAEILEASGASLIEVGSTNITELKDYQKHLFADVAMVLKVYRSCFSIVGHTSEVSVNDLSRLTRDGGIPLLVDLGSGSLLPLHSNDTSILSVLSAGASVVCFSGDKLLGGPQSGIIVGERSVISKLRKSPLYRALRPGKFEFFLLENILLKYIKGERPLAYEMIFESKESILRRSQAFCEKLSPRLRANCCLVEGDSVAGGGALPECSLPTVLIQVEREDPEEIFDRLRKGAPPIVVRRAGGKILIDLRTVAQEETSLFLDRLTEVLSCSS